MGQTDRQSGSHRLARSLHVCFLVSVIRFGLNLFLMMHEPIAQNSHTSFLESVNDVKPTHFLFDVGEEVQWKDIKN